ncbi:MAG: hypothetical protein AB7G93_19710 [Bdellovibrionales bacterium]
MMDFLFFAKTLLLTLAIVLVMQIRVGDQTMETHAHRLLTSSLVVQPLNGVAQGAAKMAKDALNSVSGHVNKNIDKGKKKKEQDEAKKSASSFRWSFEREKASSPQAD